MPTSPYIIEPPSEKWLDTVALTTMYGGLLLFGLGLIVTTPSSTSTILPTMLLDIGGLITCVGSLVSAVAVWLRRLILEMIFVWFAVSGLALYVVASIALFFQGTMFIVTGLALCAAGALLHRALRLRRSWRLLALKEQVEKSLRYE